MLENKSNSTNETHLKNIRIDEIVVDEVFRVRERENQDLIDDFVEVFEQHKPQKAGCVDAPNYPFPAVHVVRREENGEKYVLIAGFHRFMAAQKAGMDTILADEFTGNEDQAFQFALSDNSKHGLRLSRGDLKVCVEKAFLRFPDLSLEIISDMTGASKSRCSQVKKAMKQSPENKDLFSDKVTGKDGKIQSATKRAIRKPKALPEPPEQESQEPNQVPNATPPQEQPTLSVPTPANDDDIEIIRWERLEREEIRTQIAQFCHALENFELKLKSIDDKDNLFGRVRRWLDSRSSLKPTHHTSNKA